MTTKKKPSAEQELLEAAKDVAPFLETSDDQTIRVVPSIYVHPSEGLRQQADRMDARDSAIRRFHDALQNLT